MVTDLRETERVIVLPCGERSIRFRPALSVSQDEIDEAVGATRRSVRTRRQQGAAVLVSEPIRGADHRSAPAVAGW